MLVHIRRNESVIINPNIILLFWGIRRSKSITHIAIEKLKTRGMSLLIDTVVGALVLAKYFLTVGTLEMQ